MHESHPNAENGTQGEARYGMNATSPAWRAFDREMTDAVGRFVARWAHLAAPRSARGGRPGSQGRDDS